jgi:pyruvate dehydrogenase E2 component (dihydrolipoamide acetyltransferase)
MSASALVPQITLERDVDFRNISLYRDETRTAGHTFSFSDVLVAACAQELVAHPVVNSSYNDDEILQPSHINVGIAIALTNGLVAPAIMDADKKNLPQLDEERRRLTSAAHNGRLSAAETFSATFTISNLGPYKVRRFQALVVPPQAGILAVGAITPDLTLSLSLSVDHRVVDGAPGARFLSDLVDRLETTDWIEPLL